MILAAYLLFGAFFTYIAMRRLIQQDGLGVNWNDEQEAFGVVTIALCMWIIWPVTALPLIAFAPPRSPE